MTAMHAIERLPHVPAGTLSPLPDWEAAARAMDAAARVARPGRTWNDAKPEVPMARLPVESSALRRLMLQQG